MQWPMATNCLLSKYHSFGWEKSVCVSWLKHRCLNLQIYTVLLKCVLCCWTYIQQWYHWHTYCTLEFELSTLSSPIILQLQSANFISHSNYFYLLATQHLQHILQHSLQCPSTTTVATAVCVVFECLQTFTCLQDCSVLESKNWPNLLQLKLWIPGIHGWKTFFFHC